MNATEEPPTEELQLAPPQPGEAPMKQLAPYDEFKTEIEKLKKTAETLVVADASDKTGMKLARETRLGLKSVRVSVEHRHKELKASILIEGRKIDDGKNELLKLIEPLETRLLEQEQFAERELSRIQGERRVARIKEITPFLSAPLAVDLGTLTDEQYAAVKADAMDAHAARLAREQKAKEEAAAKLKAEAEERERIRLENERLKKEAEEREAAAKKEREAAAAALAAAQDKARKEAAAAQKAREEEQARFEAEAKKERERVAAERAAAEKKAREEREAIEAKAKAEREVAEKKAKAERDAAAEAARKEREEAAKENARLAGIAEAERQKAATGVRLARELQERFEKEEARKAAEAEKAEADRLAAIEAAELAPEKEKLTALAATVRALDLPTLGTEKGIAAMKEIEAKVEGFAKWIEKQAAQL